MLRSSAVVAENSDSSDFGQTSPCGPVILELRPDSGQPGN